MKKPNVLVIVAEDIGVGDYECYNDKTGIPSPNIAKIAKNGVMFTNAHATAALCAPTRYSLLTGNYPRRQQGGVGGKWGFDVPSAIAPGQQTIANLLKPCGYRTAIIGKTGIGGFLYEKTIDGKSDFNRPMLDGPNTWGFDYSLAVPRGHQWLPFMFVENGIPTCNPEKLLRGEEAFKMFHEFNCSGGGKSEGMDYADPKFNPKEIGETLLCGAEKFFDSTDNSFPFFMHFCCDGAHFPYHPPDFIRGNKIKGITGVNLRADMVHETDVLVGELVAILESRNLLSNTIICVTSDHGAPPRNGDANGNLRGGKNNIFEGGTRVPFIISYPNKIAKNVIKDELVCAMDIVPTILDLAGANIPQNQCLDAKSLTPLLSSINDGLIRKTLRIDDATVIEKPETNIKGDAVYDKYWKLVFRLNLPVQLYNLNHDPSERINLINDPLQKGRVALMTILREKLMSSPNTRLDPA